MYRFTPDDVLFWDTELEDNVREVSAVDGQVFYIQNNEVWQARVCQHD
jgi:hypothetical protein